MGKDWSASLECHLVGSGYVESVQYVRQSGNGMPVDLALEDRLTNWGRIISVSTAYAGGSCSSFWAKKYYQLKNEYLRRELILRGIIQEKSLLQKIEEEIDAEIRYEDAMQIDRAWVHMQDDMQKRALAMRYVRQDTERYIRRQLNMRGDKSVSLLLWKAKENLKTCLEISN